MQSASALPPVDRIVFETAAVRLGAFRCPADHPLFADSGPIRDPCIVFPRTAVLIQHRDGRAFAADPTLVTLYNHGQEYRRRPISRAGDLCDWYALSAEVLRGAIAEYDGRAALDDRRPIRFPFARVDARTYLAHRSLFAAAARERDPLAIEERALGLLDRVLSQAYSRRVGGPAGDRSRPAADLARDVCALLGRRFRGPLTLSEISAYVGASVFHLCRAFRRATGTTIHAHRDQLRLRSALDALEGGASDLSQLALDLGYSSHSHFTASFRRAFDMPPSCARNRLRPSGRPQRATF